MTTRPTVPDPIATLRRILTSGQHPDVVQMIRERDFVIRRYQQVFHPEHLDDLTPEEFGGFLRYENNKHWWGLHRDEDRMTASMVRLTTALRTVLDEGRPIAERLDAVEPGSGPLAVPGLAAGIVTPILLISHPDRYGVWSTVSESAMQRLGLWPDPLPSEYGARYEQINEMILTVAAELGTDPWTLDALWWGVEKENDPSKHFVSRRQPTTGASRPRPTRPARTRAARTPSSRRRPEQETFLCDTCFQQKQRNLESDRPGRCVDCA